MLQLEKTIGDYLEYCEYQKKFEPSYAESVSD